MASRPNSNRAMASTDVTKEAGLDAFPVETLGSLTPATLTMLDALVEQSGWNQTAHDWNAFFRYGSAYVIRDAHAKIVASGACLPMGKSIGASAGGKALERVVWISMILVAPAMRGTGLGRAIFHHCLRQVQEQEGIPMLDATPQGEKIYTKFGFMPLWQLTRWRRESRSAKVALAHGNMPSLSTLAKLDAQALGFDRSGLLSELTNRDDSRCVRSDSGVAIIRAGRIAHHIGPVLAISEEAAASLLVEATDRLDGPLLIDVPDDRHLLRETLMRAGFEAQRGFVRMALTGPDQAVPSGQRSFIHAIAGPEFG